MAVKQNDQIISISSESIKRGRRGVFIMLPARCNILRSCKQTSNAIKQGTADEQLTQCVFQTTSGQTPSDRISELQFKVHYPPFIEAPLSDWICVTPGHPDTLSWCHLQPRSLCHFPWSWSQSSKWKTKQTKNWNHLLNTKCRTIQENYFILNDTRWSKHGAHSVLLMYM